MGVLSSTNFIWSGACDQAGVINLRAKCCALACTLLSCTPDAAMGKPMSLPHAERF